MDALVSTKRSGDMKRTNTWKVLNLKSKVWVWLICGTGLSVGAGQTQVLHNTQLTMSVRPYDGSYEIRTGGLEPPVIAASVAAEIDHDWIKAAAYPRHQAVVSSFNDLLGHGHQITITFSGLSTQPDLLTILKVYEARPLGVIEVKVRNTTAHAVTLQRIRSLEATGEPRINLGGSEKADRILSDRLSEDNPILGDLAQARQGLHRAVQSQLIYNQESGVSLLVAALASQRFATVMQLNVGGPPESPTIEAYTVDSTGTTAAEATYSPELERIELSLPLLPGEELSSEPVMFTAGRGYHTQLSAYAEAIRVLRHARVSSRNLQGWWSWPVFYAGITDGGTLTEAQWLAENLKKLQYDTILMDEGWMYARGEYATPDAVQIPGGMRNLGHEICRLGLTLGVWTAPFEVSERAWVYQHHKDWLVHNARGEPLQVAWAGGSGAGGLPGIQDSVTHSPERERIYALDNTHPGAQTYLRQTYRTLVREWGVRLIKLDFMDSSAVEGFYYRPNTTALEAQRIGLAIIRETVGDGVLLDKDGSPMLNPVGIVDAGRIAGDTQHSFTTMKGDALGMAGRYYMNRKWFVADPDAFEISREVHGPQDWRSNPTPLTLQEAQMSIVLAALTGGYYEIGDDLPSLGADPTRLALLKNHELLQIVKLGRAAVPMDLMTYRTEDHQPSVFLLREDGRQSVLAVFNWTEQSRSHTFTLADLNLPAEGSYAAYDILDHDRPVPFAKGRIELRNGMPHSVRAIKIIDASVTAAPPSIMTQGPTAAEVLKPVNFMVKSEPKGVPAVQYRWYFGDGTSANGGEVSHTYTKTGTFSIQLEAEGVDGITARKTSSLTVNGAIRAQHDFANRRRYVEPGER